MNELQIFSNPVFGEIRTIIISGEPWMVGKDVAQCLAYSDTDQAIRTHVDDEDKLTRKFNGSGQNRKMTIINESGLYSLILGSQLPTAKQFKRWVTHDVLPSIRKTGSYSASSEHKIVAEAKLNNSRARISSMWLKIANIVKLPEYQQVCASYASAALAGCEVLPLPTASEHYYTATELGQMFGVSANQIGKIANANNLKTEEYGKTVWDKSPYSNKQVEAWRYNDRGVQQLAKLLKK